MKLQKNLGASVTWLLLLILGLLTSCNQGQPDAKTLASYVTAKTAYEAGNVAETVRILAPVCQTWPSFHQAAFVYARALYFTQSYDESAKQLSKLMHDHPDHFEATLWYVRCLIALNKKVEAKALSEHLISLNPDDSRLLWLLALQAEQENKLNDAMGFLERARSGGSDIALIYIERARIYFQLGQLEAARLEIGRAIAILDDGNPLKDSALQLAARLKTEAKK